MRMMPHEEMIANGVLRVVGQGTDEVLSSDLPRIDAGNHDLPDVTRQAWAAIVAANDPPYLFQQGNAPVRLQRDKEGQIALVPLTEHRLRCEVAQAADWHIHKGKDQHEVAAEPPLSVIQNMLAGMNPPLPVLRRITETPVFAPDGRLIETPGYDTASGVFYDPVADLTVPPVPETPTAQDIASARDLFVDDLLRNFPFTEEADRAAAFALCILPFVRDMIDGSTPLHGIESPTIGSGKGLLGDACTRHAFGQHGAGITEAGDDDEWRKRIGAKLRAGAGLIRIDNLNHPLVSGAFASALTSTHFEDRILGRNENFNVPIRCVWLFTANNPILSTEIARRTVRIRIDTSEEKPWQRTDFKHANLSRWMDEHRGDLIHAALTLIRAWIVAGKPMADLTLGSYQPWAETMGGILETAGVPGFLDNLDAFYEMADLEGAAWRQFVALWWEKHQNRKVGTSDLFDLALAVEGLDFGKGGDRSQRTSFGSQLTRQRDRIYGGYRITLAGTAKRVKQWHLLPVKPGEGVPRQQRYTQESVDIATETDEGVYLGVPFESGYAGEKTEDISTASGGQKVHRGTPDNGNTLIPQGKNRVYLDAEETHDGAAPTSPSVQKLIDWATNVLGSDWGDAEVPAPVVNLMHECGIAADTTSERATATAILAALKGAR